MNQLFKSQAYWLLLAFLPACGGDSNSGNGSGAPTTAELVASCNRTCSKMKACAGDSGFGSFINCDQICTEQNLMPRGTAGQSSAPPCDYAKVKAKLDSCEQVACSELQACQAEAAGICRRCSASWTSL